jgi:exodeoxyribonuclease VII small subunit
MNEIPINFEKTVQELSYEEAFAELAEVITTLEASDQSLGDAVRLYERGKALSQRCSQLLDQAELKIKILEGEEITDFEA